MADQMQNNRTTTSTQIRNLYSDGLSYMNIKFYNTDLSFKLSPFTGKDAGGKNHYDSAKGQTTTVNFEGAYALYKVAKDIIDGKYNEISVNIPCNGASITLERKPGQDGKIDTFFTISKNNTTIPFKFQTIQQQVKENGNVITKTIESGLGAFAKTIEGYLTGINADRHLDKLTDDYAKTQQGSNQQNSYQSNGNYRNNGYRNNSRGNYSGYKKSYNNNNNQNNGRNGWNPPPAQNFNNYQLPNN